MALAARQLPQSLVLAPASLIPERDPIVTAKERSPLDLVSQGRFRFGVGWLRERSRQPWWCGARTCDR